MAKQQRFRCGSCQMSCLFSDSTINQWYLSISFHVVGAFIVFLSYAQWFSMVLEFVFLFTAQIFFSISQLCLKRQIKFQYTRFLITSTTKLVSEKHLAFIGFCFLFAVFCFLEILTIKFLWNWSLESQFWLKYDKCSHFKSKSPKTVTNQFAFSVMFYWPNKRHKQ